MPHPIGGPEAELVVLGGSWTRDAAVVLLSAVMAHPDHPWVVKVRWHRSRPHGRPRYRRPHPPGGSYSCTRAQAAAACCAALAIERPGLSPHVIEMREPTSAAVRTAVRLLGDARYTGDDLTVHGDGTVTTVGWTPMTLPARTPRFDETLVLVTGGLGGLGARTAAMLAKLGAIPVLVDIRSPDEVPRDVRRYLAVLRHLAPAARTVQLDLSDATIVARRLSRVAPARDRSLRRTHRRRHRPVRRRQRSPVDGIGQGLHPPPCRPCHMS